MELRGRSNSVMPGLDPGIHAVAPQRRGGLGMDRRVKPGDDEKRRLLADIERDPLLSVRERDPDALGLPGKVKSERAEAHLALLPASRLVGLGALVGRPRGAKDAEDVGPLDDAPSDLEILRGFVATAVVSGRIFAEKVVGLDLR